MKLNLGGGHDWKMPGWVNLDHSLGTDLKMGLPSVPPLDAVFTSHMLEHLSHAQARALLSACCDHMKTGAIIRIVVPDCEKFAKAWLTNDQEFFDNPDLKPHFGNKDDCFVQMGSSPGFYSHASPIGHCFFWDRWTLVWVLKAVGFRRVWFSDFGQSELQELREEAKLDEGAMPLSGFDNPRTRAISCYVEAMK